uniref:Uncharacterized protein n=1 Tax=Rhizophora mucronata TaxID=61149 RepID=A0A2P2PPD1_RHIMU
MFRSDWIYVMKDSLRVWILVLTSEINDLTSYMWILLTI